MSECSRVDCLIYCV